MCRIVLWILDQVRNDVTMLVHRFHPHLSPLPSRERGFCRLFCLVAAPPFTSGLRVKSTMTVLIAEMTRGIPTVWIDESPMNLCEILGLQPKGVATLSFSSR